MFRSCGGPTDATVTVLHEARETARRRSSAHDSHTPRPHLSDREVQVLLSWLRYDSKHRAAEELFISEATVSTHIARIRQKYAEVGRPAPTKAQLVARALQDGYTTLEQW